MSIAIIDYRAGNLTSVQRALAQLGVAAAVTHDIDVVRASRRVIFPGVGAAASCMANLRELGMDVALREAIAAGKPVLGICVGMQLLFEHSEEDGGTDCLGILPGRVRRFDLSDPGLKVPHMGWNPVAFAADEPLAARVEPGAAFYFVHSYYCEPDAPAMTIARCDHGVRFCAGVRRDNLVAFQFHPEKSGPVGLGLLRDFCS
ncbi:MAG: imidazole glycerol phosphate synthase subunit HisH [Planctomycetota bacterium]